MIIDPVICLLAINALAYSFMVVDKLLAVSNSRRIPEAWLFALALGMGASGILLGMLWPVKHKTSKKRFRIFIPLLVTCQGILVYRLYYF